MLKPTLFTIACSLLAAAAVLACSDDETPAAGSDAGADGSTPPPTTTPPTSGDDDGGADAATGGGLTSGSDFSVVYSAEVIGLDARPGSSATFDENGHLTAYEAHANESLAMGAATQLAPGGTADLAWGTWQGGPTTGKFYANSNGAFNFPAPAQGFHYAVGKDAALPTGTATYALSGASTPTLVGASAAGSVTTATMTCDFTAGTCDVALTVSIGGATVSATETGNIVGGDKKQLRVNEDALGLAGLFVAGDGVVYAYVMPSGEEMVRGTVALTKE